MSFDPSFDTRWTNVIAPAIQNIGKADGAQLEPHRVDLRKASDSVMTEILQGIAHCHFFLADITVIGSLHGRPVRNANVLYEVGLALAARLPEEVVLLRSDDEELLFDVRDIRVLRYDPDGSPEAARRLVAEAVVQSLKELDLKKSLTVRKTAESLDVHSWLTLLDVATATAEVIYHPPHETFGDAVANAPRREAIHCLLETGCLRAELARVTPEFLAKKTTAPLWNLVEYKLTELGRAVAKYGIGIFDVLTPDNKRVLDDRRKESGGPEQ